jgi:hypothetical protein
MKRIIPILLVFLCISIISTAQHESKIYKTWITVGGGGKMRGTLYQTKDSSIVIANSFNRLVLQSGNFDLSTVDFKNIYLIETREDNVVSKELWKGALAGFLMGAVAGIISGFASGDDVCEGTFCIFSFRAEQKALMEGRVFGIIGLPVGAGVKAIITSSSLKITIPITGNYERFNENKERLKQYSYTH